jgi:hypothetical protein
MVLALFAVSRLGLEKLSASTMDKELWRMNKKGASQGHIYKVSCPYP